MKFGIEVSLFLMADEGEEDKLENFWFSILQPKKLPVSTENFLKKLDQNGGVSDGLRKLITHFKSVKIIKYEPRCVIKVQLRR